MQYVTTSGKDIQSIFIHTSLSVAPGKAKQVPPHSP